MKKINFKDRVFGTGKKGKSNNPADGGKKVIAGMLFAAACFAAIFVLLEFHDIYWVVGIACALLMISAFWFLDCMFSDKEDIFDELTRAQEELDRVREEDRKKADDEFKKKIEEEVSGLGKTSRAMFAAIKKSVDIQESNLSMMQIKIDKVIIDQNAGVKTMIKFNKENARQIALSEKATLEEIATRFPGGGKRIEIAPEVPDDYIPDTNYFNEDEDEDLSIEDLDDMFPTETEAEEIEPEVSEPEESFASLIPEEEVLNEEDIVEANDDIDISAAFDKFVAGENEVTDTAPVFDEAPVEEEIIEAEAEDVTEEVPEVGEEEIPEISDEEFNDLAASLDSALFEEPVTETAEEPVTETIEESAQEIVPEIAPEIEAEAEPEPEPESEPEADLSNPNANLSPEDIAKLFATVK